MKLYPISFLTLILTAPLQAQVHSFNPQPGGESCFPETERSKDLEEQDFARQNSFMAFANITEEQYDEAIKEVEDVYRPIIEAHDVNLEIRSDWNSSTVNAYASRSGNSWILKLYGGFARHKDISIDGFQAIVCHEIGHHLGGYPTKSWSWSSAEGQADYFATQTCLKKVWRTQVVKNSLAANTVHPFSRLQCDLSYPTERARNLCYRIANASRSMAAALADISYTITPVPGHLDNSRVKSTKTSHPQAQCRLDTLLAGAACTQSIPDHLIPGSKLKSLPLEAEKQAARYSCMFNEGQRLVARPRCWFKAKGKFGAEATPLKNVAISVRHTNETDQIAIAAAIPKTEIYHTAKLCYDELQKCLKEDTPMITSSRYVSDFDEDLTVIRWSHQFNMSQRDQLNLVIMLYKIDQDLPYGYKHVAIER